jgi:ubiquinone/menaquinone biosynthesis C-methylase UbiE
MKDELIGEVNYPADYFFATLKRNKTSRHFTSKLKNLKKFIGNLTKNEKILDIGTCSGTIPFNFLGEGVEIYGTDLSKQAIKFCKEKSKIYGFNNLNFKVAPADKQPFQNNYFDKVTLIDITEHLSPEDYANTLRECRRVLRRKGKIFIYTPNKEHFFEALRKAGILSEDPTHINLKAKSELHEDLIKTGFSIEKEYYEAGCIPLLCFFEKIFIKIKICDRIFGRRLCVCAIKK